MPEAGVRRCGTCEEITRSLGLRGEQRLQGNSAHPKKTFGCGFAWLIGSTSSLPVTSGTLMQRRRRHRRFLHAALSILVTFGVLLQPVLGALGEIHSLEHAAALQADNHGDVHHDGHEAPHEGEDALGDPIGEHVLLHQGGFAMSMALIEPVFLLLVPTRMDEPLDRSHSPGPPISHLTLPFRPPIA